MRTDLDIDADADADADDKSLYYMNVKIEKCRVSLAPPLMI